MKHALLLVLGTVLTSAGAEPIDLSAKLAPILQDSPVPCIGAAVIVNGQIIGYGASGVRKKGDPTPVARDDVFHIGSCGKAMTATMIGMLVDDGILRFDMPLKEAFKSAEIHPLLQPVTIRQLLDHESGLPANIPRETKLALRGTNRSPQDQRSTLLRAVLNQAPSPIGAFVYSPTAAASFVRGTVAGAASLATLPSWAAPIGANDDVRVAVIGFQIPWLWPHQQPPRQSKACASSPSAMWTRRSRKACR
jgi:hypothetical protein